MKLKHPPRVFALHAGGIGDLILALPALRAFREAFSDSSLELVGYPERLSLIAYDLKAQSLHSVDRSGMALFYSEEATLPPRLVDFFSSFSAALIFGQSRAKVLAENLRRTGLSQVMVLPSFPREGEKKHVSDFLLEELQAFGIRGSDLFRSLSLPPEKARFADEFIGKTGWRKGTRILAIHPGSGSPSKNWSPENFALVADWAGANANIFLISGPAQDGRDLFCRSLKKANPVLLDNLPLLDLASILRKCAAYLGNDSGITHLAAAVGIPALALFGPTDPTVWSPRGEKVQIIRAQADTRPSDQREGNFISMPMGEINPERVLKKLAPILSG